MPVRSDEKTVLLDRDGFGPAQGALTDFAAPPRVERLQARMIHTARPQGLPGFNNAPNPLVAAAWELLSQVAQLKAGGGRESLPALNERLASGISAFEEQARHQGVDADQVRSARYVLCSVIDEAVVTTAWGGGSDWSRNSLLSRFHNETFGGEKCFQLLENVSRDPLKHVALLELMYLGLAMGFEGKYRVMERGAAELEVIRDALYRQIRHVRGDRLSLAAPPVPDIPAPARVRDLSVGWIATGVLLCLLTMYSGFAWVLGQERSAVLQPFQPVASDSTRTPV